MFGLLISQMYAQDVRHAVEDENVVYEKIGTFSSDTFLQYCQTAAKANVQTLILDITCTDESSLIKGIKQFRLSRNSRIILLAPDREPGDPVIAALVGLQVWDIIAPKTSYDDDENEEEESEFEEETLSHLIQKQLLVPVSYANAARWDISTGATVENVKEKETKQKEKRSRQEEKEIKSGPDSAILDHIESLVLEPPPPRIKEKVIYKDRIIGTMIIAVGGADRRTGSTLAALKLAQTLANDGFKTACLERNDPDFSPNTFHLYADGESKYLNNGYNFNGVDIFLEQSNNDRWLDEAYSNYEYIVLDMGQLVNANRSSIYFHEFVRSNLHIVTTCTTDWDFDRFTKLIAYFQNEGIMKKINVLANLSDDRRYEDFKTTFSKQEIAYFQLAFYQNSFSLDLHKNDNRTISMYKSMLDSILSDKKKSLWKFWQRS
ncbi:hypothetical protein ABES02_29380 [Neobacillus pocheonensis]|uniref:hypothetical protein n=1 Tax=Neobacillus pocheonensis TaxID=363869 RepID=UPI003D2DA44F